ncbi:flowering time control protein FCA [Nicotiana sylvestris]|uniref:Flowering time control protein FCA n=1 Tax=Nicotiana sylvestris TaxID=4096 RepID=A0A1U7XL03_NICSY|nr:PREDICTED: flowering time control protein FCA [Nicotiana sylvestris]
MDQSNGERRGNQPEYHRNPHSASPNWPSDETVSLNDDNHRRNFPGDGNHYNRRQHHHHHHHQNPNSEQNFGGSPLLSARKRPYDQSTSDSQVRFGSVKLYVVGVPRPAEEEDVRSVFAEHGNIIEVVRLKDKSTGLRKECCFVKYSTLDEADRAIGAFHGRYTFPGGEVPLIIRYADGERERLGSLGEQNHKLYVGGLRKQVSKREVEHVFSPYGVVEEVFFLLDEQKQRRGSAFVSFACKDMAVAAMNALHGTYVTTKVCHQPLIVRFADPKKPKVGESRAPSHMNEQFNGNIAANQSNHQSPNKTPNNRSNPQTVFSTYVGSDIVLPSAASSVNARSLNGEMVESIDCEWSEHICPDGFVYYYNCMTCESRWEKPEEFALYEKKLEKLDLQQQDQRNLRLPVRNNPEVSQMREELETGSSTVPLACV